MAFLALYVRMWQYSGPMSNDEYYFDDPNDELISDEVEPELPDWQVIFDYAVRQAKSLGVDSADAQDVAQDTVKKLLVKNLRSRHWKGFVRTIVKNEVFDLYRNKRYKTSATGGIPEAGSPLWFGVRDVMGRPSEIFKPQDIGREIAENDLFVQILAEVPEDKREMFIDHLEGVRHAELAKIYGYASAASVTQIIGRIKQRLRDRFEYDAEFMGDF